MKTLLILRHAKSSWSESGTADHDRPLNKRGQETAPRMGELIKAEGLTPDLILSSTAKRAHKTADKVAKSCGYDGDVELRGSLYLATPDAYFLALNEVDDAVQRVLVIGHNPGLEDLLERLTGVSESLPTAALAQVALEISTWREAAHVTDAALVNLWRPRELE